MKKYLSLTLLTVLLNCTPKYSYLKNGDLLFLQAEKENLSGAISRVTRSNNNVSYDHIAIVEIDKNKKFVLHAAPQKGSVKETLNDFLKNYSTIRMDVYRVKKTYSFSINPAVKKANTLLNKPYNIAYILNENSYYCSDFIERSYRQDSIFTLDPMTFINPETGKTDEYWQEFYNKLNVDIPEGEPGCNPNGLSRSSKIYKVKTLKH